MKNWTPILHEYIKNDEIKQLIHSQGYKVVGNIGKEALAQLINFYNKLHNIKTIDGAMYYSIYSQDLAYREQINKQIGLFLKDEVAKYLSEHHNALNSFIVKVAGKKSEFALHQDYTICDETKYSPLTLWIPLQDTNIENGALCVVPFSHHLYSPYRGIGIEPQYQKYQSEIKKYLLPIEMKAGDILFFDNRLLHYSPPNLSNKNRVVVSYGVLHPSATLEICYQNSENNTIEIYQQENDFLLTHKGFHTACDCKPETGLLTKEIKVEEDNVNVQVFLDFAEKHKLKINNLQVLKNENHNTFTVTDANYSPTLMQKLKNVLSDK